MAEPGLSGASEAKTGKRTRFHAFVDRLDRPFRFAGRLTLVGIVLGFLGTIMGSFFQYTSWREEQNLARYKVPREIEVHDELPRNETGKVLKRELKEA